MLESEPKECITESKKKSTKWREKEKEKERKRENVCVDQPIVHHPPFFKCKWSQQGGQ